MDKISRQKEILETFRSSLEKNEERRDYELNPSKSMRKKLQATEKRPITVTETGGGIKLEMNTGLYELFKQASDAFYSSDYSKYTYVKIPVSDRKGRNVETKYKAFEGNVPMYTINLYHTTCTCLINGSKTAQFMSEDLHSIISVIETELVNENTTVEDVNANLKQVILDYQSSCSGNTCSEGTNDICLLEIDSPSVASDIKETAALPMENAEHTNNSKLNMNLNDAQNTQTNNPTVDESLAEIKTAITLLRQTMEQHILLSEMKFEQIKDEIQSVKSLSRVQASATCSNIETLTETSSHLKSQISEFNNSIQKRLQSISDSIKHGGFSQKKEQLHHVLKPSPEKKPQSTPQENLKTAVQSRNEIVDQRQKDTDETFLKRPFSKEKTLIIGDSLMRGIQKRGLAADVEIKTMPGAKLDEVARRLNEYDLSNFSNIIIYIGGNDVASGKSVTRFRAELVKTTTSLQERGCVVCICNVCPRRDVDVRPLNDVIAEVCKITAATYIDVNSAFIYADGTTARHFYHKDGIHLNERGTRTLVSRIHKGKVIIKERQVQFSRETVQEYRDFHDNTWRMRTDRRIQSRRRRSNTCSICGGNNHISQNCYHAQRW